MENLPIFNNINNDDINKMLHCFKALKKKFKCDEEIISNMSFSNLIGIILSGSANMIRYDLNGNRNIIENLEINSLFGKIFSYLDNDISIVATSDCEILFFDYDLLMKKCDNNCECHKKLVSNILNLLSEKIVSLNERVEVLSKRSIKDKLLSYFNLIAKKKGNNSFYLPLTYTELADYLSIDRSAMMRELKNMKDEKIIFSNGKKITIN